MIDKKLYASATFSEDLRYEILKKTYDKVQKKSCKSWSWQNECSLDFRALALQFELNKVSIFNHVKFKLQNMSFKIERAFEITTKFSIIVGSKRM